MLLNIPWTTAISRSSWTGENAGEKGNGFADKGLRIQCDCYLTIDHGLLRSQKFRKDVQDLVVRTIPMPGTLLNPDGTTQFSIIQGSLLTIRLGRPKTYKYETSRLSQFRSTYKTAFPNRLLNMGGATEIIEQTEIRQATGTGPPDSFDAQRLGMISVDDIRASIERSMASSSLVKAATHGFTSKVGKLEKVSVRRMMSSYWENSSIFSMDLVGAVIRQGTFVQKMHQIDWLHSPAIRSTMERIIEKYERFFTIISVHPAQVAVPTLDVDLAWHTHQLSPPSYYTYSVFRTSKLIDHDDKINENKLSTSFEWTSKTYEKMFQTVYSECTCWYCEAIRESHTSKLSSLFSSSKTGVASDLEKLRKDPNPNLCDPNKTAHISAHNAIRTQNYPDTRIAERVKSRQLERGYQKAIDRAKKEGRPPPKKDDYMYYYAWGYPMYMPMYVPYMGDPCIHGDMYASNPSCGNFTQGAAGNCCAGTCGGSAGMGSCGAGGCSSSACAGGGGGAGCGGGGGGCGGGGGGGGGGCGGGGGG